jgi:hypothetical protein
VRVQQVGSGDGVSAYWLSATSWQPGAGTQSLSEEVSIMDKDCERCLNGKAHHHIAVEDGIVLDVCYISADGYLDRQLEDFEYFVEYK